MLMGTVSGPLKGTAKITVWDDTAFGYMIRSLGWEEGTGT